MYRNKSLWVTLDWWSVFLFLALLTLGWMSIYSAEYTEFTSKGIDFSKSHGKQLLWIIASILIGSTILLIDSKFYTSFSYLIFGAIMSILVMVLLFGATIKGSKSWFILGPIRFQPAEFAKFAAALALAKYLSSTNLSIRKWQGQLAAAIWIIIPMALVLGQGDAGSALVFSSFVFVLFREGLPSLYLIFAGAMILLSVLALVLPLYILWIVIILSGLLLIFLLRRRGFINVLIFGWILFASVYVYTIDFAFNQILKPHQRERINVLLGRDLDLKGAAYNLNQSKIAIGSGGWKGKGFLQGTQTKFNFVPEQTTDFIFCTIGEEGGFIGSFITLSLIFGLILRCIFLAERQRSRYSRIYGYGVASILFFHFLVNVGMTIGLVPVMGIPFPFLSYGGSSIIGFTILLFILLKLDSDRMAVLR